MIKIEGISKEFKEGIGSKRVRALEDLTLDIHKGEGTVLDSQEKG